MKKQSNIYTKIVAVLSSAAIIASAAGVSVAFAAITFSGSSMTGDSSFNSIVGATSTVWDLGAAANTLSLQTTNNGPITFGSGLFTVGGNIKVTGTSTLTGIANIINIDRSGVISIGTSSATTITIGRTAQTVVFPGNTSVTGTTTISGIADIVNIDRAGSISIGTSSATAITIGRSGVTVVNPGNSSTTGTMTVGDGGTAIVRHLSATSSITFGVITSSTCAVQTMTVTGTNAGDIVNVSPTPVSNGIDTASTTWSAWATSNTVNIRACNPTGSDTVSIAAQTWRANVWQY